MLYHNQAAAQPPEQIYGLEGESVVEWTDFLSTLRQDSSNVALTSAAALRRKCSRRKEEREISIKTSLQDMIVTSTKYTKTSMMRITKILYLASRLERGKMQKAILLCLSQL